MSTEALLRHAVKGAIALGSAGSLVGAGAALAQTSAPASSTAGSTNLSNIIVTGSHIPRSSIATAQPVITINRQEIDNTGFTTVGELLQNMSQSGTALNVQYNNGGTGQEFINLHDLGSQRVLVLVNGQRWVPTLGGRVDLTTIPLSVVERVEVLLNGASAVYGSEAMAGVINVITKKNYNGAEAHAYYGMYDGHGDGGGWDGKTQQYSFTVGNSGDRSGVLLSAGYYDQQAIWAGQRTISKEPYLHGGQAVGSSNTLGGRFLMLGVNGANPTFPGCTPTNSGPYTSFCDIAGPMNGPNANTHPFTNADRYNYAPLNYLRTPQERWYIFSQGHYDLTNNVTFKFTTAYDRRNSHQLLAPNPWALGLFGYTANGLPIGVSSTNPYNPFGMDLVPAYASSTSLVNAWCNKYGTGATPGTCTSKYESLLLLGFRPINAGVRDFQQNTQTFYFNGGFNGFFDVGGNEWNWNANYIYGQTLETQITKGLADTARIQNALGPVSSCNSLPGCVPLDMFGGYQQQTQKQLNYLLFTAHDVYKQVVRDYNFGIGGQFWDNWYAGPWGVAAGYEYEALSGDFSPDPLISEGNTVGNVVQPTSGRTNTNAQYVELNIPLASNMPLAKEISVDFANRWSQFKWDGQGNVLQGQNVVTGPATGRAHASTGRMTLKWRPVSQLLFRGSWSQGFRIPAISELFGGASDSYPQLVDPCATSGTLPAGCNGLQHNQPNAQIRSTIGGSANLQPEKSITQSAGFVYSPRWAPGFDFGADFYKTEVTNIINRAGGQYYLDQCYKQQNQAACSHIIAPGSGAVITNILDLNYNIGSQKVEGWDVNFRYRLPTTPIGDFAVSGTMDFMREDVQCGATGQCGDYAGTASGAAQYGQPKHRYNFNVDWNYGPWAATWKMYVIGPMWENCGSVPGYVAAGISSSGDNWCSNPHKGGPGSYTSSSLWPIGQNRLGTTVYNDVQASYTVSSWNTTFSLGVNNVFDKQPPVSRTAFANSYLPVYYRTPGRFFYGRISVQF